MLVESKTKNGVLIFTPQEQRLDAMLAANFKNKFTECLDEGHNNIVINLSHVEFIDSSGLGALVSCLKLLKSNANGKIALCELTMAVASMFKFTRMDKIFILCDNENQAIQKLSNSEIS